MLELSTRTTDSNFQSTQHFKMDFGLISTMGKSSSPGPGTPIADYTLVVAVYSYLCDLLVQPWTPVYVVCMFYLMWPQVCYLWEILDNYTRSLQINFTSCQSPFPIRLKNMQEAPSLPTWLDCEIQKLLNNHYRSICEKRSQMCPTWFCSQTLIFLLIT